MAVRRGVRRRLRGHGAASVQLVHPRLSAGAAAPGRGGAGGGADRRLRRLGRRPRAHPGRHRLLRDVAAHDAALPRRSAGGAGRGGGATPPQPRRTPRGAPRLSPNTAVREEHRIRKASRMNSTFRSRLRRRGILAVTAVAAVVALAACTSGQETSGGTGGGASSGPKKGALTIAYLQKQ